jgi:two-component system response regulator AtoC
MGLQAKLLRVIQEKEVERVGGNKLVKVDVRLISTSNREMREAIENKIFREDLYYRLNVVPIHLPPLRERREDIMPLAGYFLERLCIENHKKKKKFSERAHRKLMDYHWPGNIRELANIIERAVVLDIGTVIDDDQLFLEATNLSEELQSSVEDNAQFPSGLSLREMERQLILKTLKEQNENRTRTAEVLGISIRTLRNKLHEYRASNQVKNG